MRKLLLVATAFISIGLQAQNQKSEIQNQKSSKPKLVVGIVIDQMRWDYLQRFQSLYKTNGGFKRMMGEGYSCDNTFIPYTPTITACGHTCAYTGSVPNIHGIVGNGWYDRLLGRNVYCSEDKSVEGVGSKSGEVGQMSPKNMLTTTICDELRLASNFQSKVIGIAIKDRGAILPAGHSANGAYWYDGKTGNFITSTYYAKELPAWVNAFNNRKIVDSLYKLNWNTALPKETYLQYATEDVKEYEAKPLGKEQLGFPYDLSKFIGKDWSKISSTPHGNTLTAEMAKATVVAEQLGKGKATDFIAISFSSPDYIGHSFGPNSWEMVDDYVRLDEELGKLFDFLDKQIGKGQYTAFLTADHAVAHVPGFMKEHKLPAGTFDDDAAKKEMNKQLKEKFGADTLIVSTSNYQIHLNHPSLTRNSIDKEAVTKWIVDYLEKLDAISKVFPLDKMMQTPMNDKLKQMLSNGYYPTRSGDIQMILKPGYIDGGATGTTHGLWNPYDSHIPLLWYGWGIKHGSSHKEVYMTDIAATVAALLKIQMPNGCVGKVIEEVMK
jgi:predicted AlkP superfamily pyrophosphatase or phosphodiesterase